ncbi:MAG: HPr family phosphocarrier protein [Lachnospiraceae bacterium]|nr:HPr family phosphocarrier protein [Lachnospiraceae bacterium]
MKEKKIRLTTLEDAKEFVKEAMKCDFDIDIYYNRVVIDAKSILGVLSLDLTKVLTVRMYGDNAAFDAYLERLAADAVKQIA